MWLRALVTALALTYLICVLSLSGVQKEDLDVNTLKKLKQHNVNLDDLNNDTLRQGCLANSKVELSSNKQEAGAALATPTWHPVVTESILRYSSEPQAAEVPDIEKIIKYFKTPPIQPARTPEPEVDDKVLKDEGVTKLTTIAHTATSITNVTDNNSLLNPDNLMKFWSMYANFQQSQKEVNKIQKNPTTTTPKAEQRTEKNNIFQITINKYTKNESFLEKYFDNHRNKTETIKRPDLASSHIMETIHDFISKKLFANDDELSKEASTLNGHVTMQVNRIKKSSQKRKVDKTVRAKLDTFVKDNDIIKTVMSKLPPQILEDIAKEVQDLVLRGLSKTTSQPRVVTPKVNPDVTNDISEIESDKMPTVLLGSVVDEVKKMLLNELRKDSTFKASVTTSTARAVTDAEILSSTKKPESADRELDNFIKLFKKFKSWKESSSSSSKEDLEAASLKNRLENSEATYQSYGEKVRKNNRKLKTINRDKYTSSQLNDSSTNSDPINQRYPKYHEKNVITEDEEKSSELDSISVQFPLPYRTIYSEKNKPTKTDISADDSVEKPNSPARNHNPNHRFKNKQARKKVPHRLQKKGILNKAPNVNSFENNYPTINKGTNNQVEDYLKMPTKYSSNNENNESHGEEVLSTENNDKFNAQPSQNKDGETLIPKKHIIEISKLKEFNENRPKHLVKNIDTNARHKMTPTLDGNSNMNAVTAYGKSHYPDNNFAFQDEEGNVNLGNIAAVYSQNASENKIKRNQDFLRNNPNLIYNPYGSLNYSGQNNESKTLSSGNTPHDNQMLPRPYADPKYSIHFNNKPGGSSQSDFPNENTGAAFKPYGAPNYPTSNNNGGSLAQIRDEVNYSGYLGAPNYSDRNNIGDNQDQIQFGATSANNPNTHYSAQNKIGIVQPSGTISNPNSMAAYPYAAAQYSAKNQPGETKLNTKNFVNIQNPPAVPPYGAPSYPTFNKIEDTKGHFPAAPLNSDNTNTGFASPFAGIFGAKVKFPVIQDPRVEALMKNPNLNAGPSFNSFPTETYPQYQITNRQRPMADFQNLYMRERQDIISPGLVSNTLNNANIQGAPLAVQNPYANQPSPYRERQGIIAPSMVRSSRADANLPKPNNVQLDSHVAQTNPYSNAQRVVSSVYAKQPMIVPASRPNDADLPKHKVSQSGPIDSLTTKNENTFNTITKIYPPHSIPKKEKDNSDQTPPIMIQTNDDEIMPLGIPIQIKGESKFHMRMIQNQHIIVTTTARPRSKFEDWNNYRLSKHTRVTHKTKKPKLAPSASHHKERFRTPMTHHDFEDLTRNEKQSQPSNYYRYEANDMRPKSEQEFDSRPLHQYAPESVLDNGQHYNPKMQENTYPRHRFAKPERVSLFRNQEKMHDSINAGYLTIAERHQLPLKRPQVNFDDTHFQNFLKTQEKVNDMLERILVTRPKNLTLEPFKGDR